MISKRYGEVINERMVDDLFRRKNLMKSVDGLLASAHILVFGSSPLKKGIEHGEYSATMVEDPIFDSLLQWH